MTYHRSIFSFSLRHRHGFLSPASDSEPSLTLHVHIFDKSSRLPRPSPSSVVTDTFQNTLNATRAARWKRNGSFFQFVWNGATRLSSRTAPLCSPLLTDSLSQEARGLYACPQKILNPQGQVILVGLWGGGGGVLLFETKQTFHSSRLQRRASHHV